MNSSIATKTSAEKRLSQKLRKKILYVCTALLVNTGIPAATAQSCGNEFECVLLTRFPYEANGVAVEQALSEFSRRTALPVRVHDGVGGTVTVRNAEGSAETFLDAVSAASDAVYWYDGVALHIETRASIRSAYTEARGFPIEQLRAEIDALGLKNEAFPLRATKDGGLIRIAGPNEYVEQVGEVVNRLVILRQSRRTDPDGDPIYLPRVYHGRNSMRQ